MQLGLLGLSIVLYLGSHFKKRKETLHNYSERCNGISNLQRLLAETMTYVVVTMVVSCAVRMRQTPTTYEQVLIPPLLLFQIYLQSLHVVTMFATPPRKALVERITRWAWTERDRFMTFHIVYLLLNLVLFTIALPSDGLHTSSTIEQRRQALLDVINACRPSQALQYVTTTTILTKRLVFLAPWMLLMWLLYSCIFTRFIAKDPQTTWGEGTSSPPNARVGTRMTDLMKFYLNYTNGYWNSFLIQAVLTSIAHIAIWFRGYDMMAFGILIATITMRCGVSCPKLSSGW